MLMPPAADGPHVTNDSADSPPLSPAATVLKHEKSRWHHHQGRIVTENQKHTPETLTDSGDIQRFGVSDQRAGLLVLQNGVMNQHVPQEAVTVRLSTADNCLQEHWVVAVIGAPQRFLHNSFQVQAVNRKKTTEQTAATQVG
jgi:predicted GNAT family acetyltransferase